MDVTQVYGPAHFLLVFELCAAAILSLFVAIQRVSTSSFFLIESLLNRVTFSKLFFSLTLLLLFYSQWLSEGREIAAVGLAMPGSLVTRSLVLDVSLWVRRLIEPSVWLFVLCLFVAGYDASEKRARSYYTAAAWTMVAVLLFEVLLLFPPIQTQLQSFWIIASGIHFTLTQCVMLLLVAGILRETSRCGRVTLRAPSAWKTFSGVVILVALFATILGTTQRLRVSPGPALVGAHFYSWFPGNWQSGMIGDVTVPPVEPALGHYKSGNEAVFAQQVAWAKEAGLDFFVFDWWPKRPSIGKNIYHHVMRRRALDGMQFALLYESLDVKDPGDKSYAGEEPNVAFMTEERAYRLKKHWEYLARHYFKSPQYLRIDGKPVLFVYASRHLVGPVAKAIREARAHVYQTTGYSLFLIGDEVFFNALRYSNQYGLLLLPENIPNWDRLVAFDAITSYNPYDSTKRQHAGSAGSDQFLQDVSALYARYRGLAATAGIRFFPGVLAAYNDRGVRPAEDHYVVPRRVNGDGWFLLESLKKWGFPMLDNEYPLMTITSWNEWNEGSQIEPTKPSSETARDISESGTFFTQGERYEGYGTETLRVLREFLDVQRKAELLSTPPSSDR